MSTIKEIQHSIKQAQHIFDSIPSEIYGMSQEQLDSFNAIPKSIIPASPIRFDSKLTEIFNSDTMNVIQQQQKIFDSVYAIASTVNVPDIQKYRLSGSAKTVGEYLVSVKDFQRIFDSLTNIAIPAESFKSALGSVSIPCCDKNFASFVDSASEIIISDDFVDLPDTLANSVSQEKNFPENTFTNSDISGFKRVARNIFEWFIAPIIVQLIITFVFSSPNAPAVQLLKDIYAVLSDGVEQIISEERRQTAEEKKQTLELKKQTKLLEQIANDAPDLKER